MKRLMFVFCAWLFPAILFPQEKSPFRPQFVGSVTRRASQTFTCSDTISLENFGKIYSLSIDATIQQPREASFTRIVLEDKNGLDYLVAESDWFRNDTTIVNLSDYCEETAMLDGIEPAYLKCYLSNATLTIHSISSAPGRTRGAQNVISAKDLKRVQVQNIVDRINAYNDKHGKLWQAGMTGNALMYCLKNDSTNKMDSYLNNLKYYIGGFYEFGERSQTQIKSISPYIHVFDWRNRHGKNWITTIKDQTPSGLCTAFAAVAVTETAAKLYFNTEDEIDLSEYAVGYYSGVDYYNGIITSNKHYPIRYIKKYGAIDEATVQFPDHYIPLPETCPQGNECMKISDYITVPATSAYVDSLKHYLIHKGPAQSGLHNLNHNHAMALVGYGEITADTVYHFIYHYNRDTIYAQTSNMIGKDFWIFKNSYGVNDVYGHQGYAYYVFNDYQYMHEAFFPITPISSLIYDDNSINITDFDGDGYFNWGIGPKPAHCPAWAPDEPDGDDSNYMKGPMDEYGYCAELDSLRKRYVYIENDTTLTWGTAVNNHYVIWKGATATLTDNVSFNEGTVFIVDKNSTLFVDGAILNNVTLRPQAGSHIIVNNNGKIVMANGEKFDVPVGATLELNCGSIE